MPNREVSGYNRFKSVVLSTPGLGERSLRTMPFEQPRSVIEIPRHNGIRINYTAYSIAHGYIGQPQVKRELAGSIQDQSSQHKMERHVLLVLENEQQRVEQRRSSDRSQFYQQYLHVASDPQSVSQLDLQDTPIDLIIFVGNSIESISPTLYPDAIKLHITVSQSEAEKYYAPQGVSENTVARMHRAASYWNRFQRLKNSDHKNKRIEEILYELYPYDTFTNFAEIPTLTDIKNKLTGVRTKDEARLWLTACGIQVVSKEDARKKLTANLQEKWQRKRRNQAILQRTGEEVSREKFEAADRLIKLAFGDYYERMIGLSDHQAAQIAGVNNETITYRRRMIEKHPNYRFVASGREILANAQKHAISIETVLVTPDFRERQMDVPMVLEILHKRFHQMRTLTEIANDYPSPRRNAQRTYQGMKLLIDRVMEKIDTAILADVVSKDSVTNEDGKLLLRYAREMDIDLHLVFPRRSPDKIEQTIGIITDRFENHLKLAEIAEKYDFSSHSIFAVNEFINRALGRVKIAIGEKYRDNPHILQKTDRAN